MKLFVQLSAFAQGCYKCAVIQAGMLLRAGWVFQVGAYEKDPERLAVTLERWLKDVEGDFAAMRARAAELGKHFSGGLFRIVKDLASLAEQSGQGCAPAFAKYAKRLQVAY